MLAVWLVVVSRLRVIPTTPRPHRFELGQMSATEKRWTLAVVAFGTGLIAWLNAAATVDWSPLVDAVEQGKPAPTLLACGLAAFALAMVAGAAFSWRRATAAYKARTASHI
jgi:hypothetical protein